jgi:hypothetical protein
VIGRLTSSLSEGIRVGQQSGRRRVPLCHNAVQVPSSTGDAGGPPGLNGENPVASKASRKIPGIASRRKALRNAVTNTGETLPAIADLGELLEKFTDLIL